MANPNYIIIKAYYCNQIIQVTRYLGFEIFVLIAYFLQS